MLFESTELGQFADVARPLGCDAIEDSRGVAIADLNDDGRLDIVVTNNNGKPAIYLNQLSQSGNWLRANMVASANSNRSAIGTRVQLVVETDGKERKITRWVEAGTGYSAQSDMRVHFGLAGAQEIKVMKVTWPDGSMEEFAGDHLVDRLNSTIRVEQGRGVFAGTVDFVADASAQLNSVGTSQ